MAKRELKKEKNGKAKSTSKKKQRRSPIVKGVFPDFDENSDEHSSCDICGLKYCTVQCTFCKGVAGSVAINVKRGIMKTVLTP